MPSPSRLRSGFLWSWITAVLLSVPCSAENWPGFRGPTGQGISSEADLPLTWSLTENLAWRVDVPGIGWSSPIVWQDHVFVTSVTPDGTSCHVISIDADHGKILWDREVIRQNTPRKLAENSHATPTPVTDGNGGISVLRIAENDRPVSTGCIRVYIGINRLNWVELAPQRFLFNVRQDV